MKSLFQHDESFHSQGNVLFSWQKDGSFLATCGTNGLVNIFNRHGKQVDEVALGGTGECIGLDWDKDGETLAILVRDSCSVFLYNLGKKRMSELETSLKDLCFLSWSSCGPQLAIGTKKGNVLLYRKDTRKKVPVLGKHSGEILCGGWSRNNVLALGSADNTVSVSNENGDTLDLIESKHKPTSISFCYGDAHSGSTTGCNTSVDEYGAIKLAINTGDSILMYDFKDIENPFELAFQSRYGSVIGCGSCGEGKSQLLVAFSAGYVVMVSTVSAEVGEELQSIRLFKSNLSHFSTTDDGLHAVCVGDGGIIKLFETSSWKEAKSEHGLSTKGEKLLAIRWARGGQIITYATERGRVTGFLVKIPTLSDSCDTEVAYLSSLREVSIVDVRNEYLGHEPETPVRVPLQIEPTFLALGENHLAVGSNNRVMFYKHTSNPEIDEYNHVRASPNSDEASEVATLEQLASSIVPVSQQEYIGSVSKICLNDTFAAVLCNGQVHLHRIEPLVIEEQEDDRSHRRQQNANRSWVFPSPDTSEAHGAATCLALTKDFLFFGTREGYVEVFALHDGKMASGCELSHVVGIRQLFPNHNGTRIVVLDETGSGLLYNPVSGEHLRIPDLSPATSKVLWDRFDTHVFVAHSGSELSTYATTSLSINGPDVVKVGPMRFVDENDDSNTADGELVVMEPLATPLPASYTPVVSVSGNISCQLANAQLGSVILGSHQDLLNVENIDTEMVKSRYLQALALWRFKDAWEHALIVNERPYWLALSSKAMEQMDVELAINVWRQLGDAGMVVALEDVRFVEDKHLLAGHIAALFGDYAQAQDLFLQSPDPKCALSMRRDLLHWDHALKLAEALAPEEIPEISTQFAQQLEFKGEYQQALVLYESAAKELAAIKKSGAEKMMLDTQIAHLKGMRKQCLGGVARMTLRVGNVPRGVMLAQKANDKVLCRECADILVSLKQFPDAAVLYEQAEHFEQAASILIKVKNFKAVGPLMAKISAPRLHLQYAKAKEAEKDYKVAAQEYDRAKDMDSVVRLYLDHLNLPEKAFTIVRHTHSAAGAELVARYCQGVSDFRGAIEFLLMAKRSQDAFDLATAHECMDVYERALGADGSPEEYVKVGHYYETKQECGKAGEFYSICGQYHKALKLFLQDGNAKYIDRAIDVVGKARNDMLTHTLIDFLMGETNGAPQPPNYIFRLYMALGNYPQAAKTAIIIARQEQDIGNYREAHRTLYETHHELEVRDIRIPQALRRALLLLHSYILVKKLFQLGKHANAARMLLRVARSISRFPSHTVQILTSTVVSCMRAGLKQSAFEYATTLMRAEYRTQIEPNLRRRIERIVRQRGSEVLEDEEEPVSPCPYTGKMIPVTELICPDTRDDIPYCVVTGQHMVLDDWCICPNSKMPALYSEYVAFLNALEPDERVDPVLGQPISASQLEKISDPKKYLEKYSTSPTEGDENDSDSGSSAGGKHRSNRRTSINPEDDGASDSSADS